MGLLDDAIREHLELKRRRGASESEITRMEQEALAPVGHGESFVEPPVPATAAEPVADAPQFDEGTPEEPVWADSPAPDTAVVVNEDALAEPVPAEEPLGAVPISRRDEPPVEPASVAEPPVEPIAEPPVAEHPEPVAEPVQDEPATELMPAAEPVDAPVESPGRFARADESVGDIPRGEARRFSDDDPWLEEDEVQPTSAFSALDEAEATAEPAEGEDVLEATPDFLQEAPEHDRLWFEQKPPKDFDFDS